MDMLKETFCVRFVVDSDFDEEDKDHLVTITAPSHYLKAMDFDLTKHGFEWHQFSGNNDVYRKYVKERIDADVTSPIIQMLGEQTELHSNIHTSKAPK